MMKKLTLIILAVIFKNFIYASDSKADEIKGKWNLKSISIDGSSQIPSEKNSTYIYFRYDLSKQFYHKGSYQIVNGNGSFNEYNSFQNYYQLKDDSIKFVGPKLLDNPKRCNTSFDLGNELYGEFKFSINNNHLLIENEKITLHYEKDSVINYGLEKAANSPDFGFDRRLIGSWNLVKMDVPKSLVEEVNRNIEKAYEKKHNRGIPQKKRPKKLIELGKHEVQRFLEDGGWTIKIGDFYENTSDFDTISYGNFIGYSDGCNSCRGYINISESILSIYNTMCTAVACFPNFTGAFKNSKVFNNATYYFEADTLIIKAIDRTSYFVPVKQNLSVKKNDYKSLNKHYKLVRASLENKELENIVSDLILDNDLYFRLNGGWGVNPKNRNCSGKKMEIYLYNDENYFMQYLMTVFHENLNESQDSFKYNCVYVRNEQEITKYIDIKELLGEKYFINIEGNNLTFRSSDNRNFLRLKSNY